MPFEPEEIENKEFLSALRGYDRDEVRGFLQDVADDYRALLDMLKQRQQSMPSVKDPYDVVGVELGQILKVARESGDRLRKKAEAEAGSLVGKSEQEAKSIRDSADKAARKQREEADRYARQVRAAADREAADKTSRAAATVEQLREAEAKLRERLRSMESIIRAVRDELGAEEGPRTERRPAPGPATAQGAGPGDGGPSDGPGDKRKAGDERTIRLDEASASEGDERIFSSGAAERANKVSGEGTEERRRPRFI